jgi:predicted glycogen debranching enzyme
VFWRFSFRPEPVNERDQRSAMSPHQPYDPNAEWLETDGLGGFASGTAGLIRTRRYHALLLSATSPPTGRMVLVNGIEAWVETAAGTFALSSHRYTPDVVHPDGASRVAAFTPVPWPQWTFTLPEDREIEHGVFVQPGRACTVLYWRIRGDGRAKLRVRPLVSGRDYHSLHHRNPAFNFTMQGSGSRLVLRPYQGVPAIAFESNGAYRHAPDWYGNFLYTEERARGLDHVEDLASPGTFEWDLDRGEAWLILCAEGHEPDASVAAMREAEMRRRAGYASRLNAAADAYIVRRGPGKTIVAGYPWFTDWGRDTFISVRGLCIARGRFAEARDILLQWTEAVSDGMLPNRFPDRGETAEYNSVDASLWYVIAVHDLISSAGTEVSERERRIFEDAVDAILEGYARGTRFGIRLDSDGLIAAGAPGVQLTWMDAKVGDWVVTPRIGKPVEVQALWLNALSIAAVRAPKWAELFAKGRASFISRFWNDARGYLNDVVDCDHVAGRIDQSFRPNQIFAIGGLPLAIIHGDRARRALELIEALLVTPMGLRSLAPGEPGYCARYEGGVRERDAAYHQGTVWPWLVGPFVEAWVRARGSTPQAKREAKSRFLAPLLDAIDRAGLGHLPEIADAEPPHAPRGCYFQAWSVGEALRLAVMLG